MTDNHIKNLGYPEGAITSVAELENRGSRSPLFLASRKYNSIRETSLYKLKNHWEDDPKWNDDMYVAQQFDYNVARRNNYNDWFVFENRDAAQKFIGGSPQYEYTDLPYISRRKKPIIPRNYYDDPRNDHLDDFYEYEDD